MQTRKFDEMISYFNRKVSDMYIDRKYKMELLAMITAIGMAHEKELDAQLEQRWIPCSERLPEEDHWLGGSGRQFSDEVLVSVANYDDEDIWTYISQTIDGEWALELPSYCKIIAWMPLPEPYQGEGEQDG